MESKNNNNHLNISPIKNETSTKYNNAFDILNNMNNNKYTMKYIEESRHKVKNYENDFINNNIIENNNHNNPPINLNNNRYKCKNYNRSSSYLNKTNIKGGGSDKNKNKSMKKNNSKNLNMKKKEKKDNNNIHEYKINNLSSSYSNNFTNIKTNKIVFIDLKDNNNFLKNDLNNENQNNNLNLNSSRSGNLSNKSKTIKSNNINSDLSNESNIANKKNNNNEMKNILRNSKNSKNNKGDNNTKIVPKTKFSNLIQQTLTHNNKDNKSDNFKIFEDKKRKEIKYPKIINQLKFEELKSKKLTSKEISYYILSKSPILRLYERMIFSRSSQGLRNILPKEIVLKDHEIVLKMKIEELKKKIILCDKILDTPFSASKTADITLNFITSFQESEFKDFPIILANDEEKKYYINYLKIIYNLLEEEIENKDNGKTTADQNNMIINLRQNLYVKINAKGFKSLRDYLYNIFITKKEYIKEIPKIVEINYLLTQVNNMFEIHNSLKICKFISFTLYLIKEIVKFGNNIKSSVELKIKAKNLIEILNKKLNKYNSKFKKNEI